MKKSKTVITDWLDKNGNAETETFIETNLEIVTRILDIMKEKKMSKSDLADKLGKQPSEISKLLSGFHNLSLKTIVKIQVVLGEKIIVATKEEQPVTPVKEYVYLTAFVSSNKKSSEDYQPTKISHIPKNLNVKVS